MKEGWKTKGLGEVAAVSSGNSAPQDKSFFANGTHPFIRTSDVGQVRFGAIGCSKDYLNADGVKKLRRFEKGTILLPKSGASTFLNHRVVMAIDGYVASHLATVRALESITEPRFLLYYLSTVRAQDLIQDHKYPSLNLPVIKSIQVPVPPLPEQKRIVAILDEAFAGIDRAVANAERNLANARELFESHLNAVFTQKGEGWVEKPIGEVAEIFDGPHATPKTVEVGPVFLGIRALQDGRINLEKTRHVTPDDFRHWTRRVKPQADDIVFSYETRLGQAAVIPSSLECCLGRRMGLVRPNRKRLDPRFFVYQYISPPFREFLNRRTIRGATVDRIALREFPSFPIALPVLDEQEQIAELFESLREDTNRLARLYQRKLDALAELKQSILHKAFSGEL